MADTIEAIYALCPSALDGATGTSSDSAFLRCPFCGGGENTPPVSVSRADPVFFCHSCKNGGHISAFLKRCGVSSSAIEMYFPRAKGGRKQKPEQRTADIIPKYADSRRTMRSGRLVRVIDPFKGLYALHEDVLQRFRGHVLQGLLNDGFKQETIDHFGVGFDITRMKVTYPLRNIYGELVGISGRAPVGDDGPKYKIYEHELVDWGYAPEGYSIESVKHALLWNWEHVGPVLRAEDSGGYLILTEGFKAAMWIWQMGYTNVVACVGSSFTDSHSEIIARVRPEEVIIFFDNDDAGKTATAKALRSFLHRGISARAAVYPEFCESLAYEEDVTPRQPDDLQEHELDLAIQQATELREAKQWLES